MTSTPNLKPGWNVHAREFTPSTAQSSPAMSFRVDAPAFMPSALVKTQVADVIAAAGVAGIRIKDIPAAFAAKFETSLDLSSCPFSDLSVLVASIDGVTVADASPIKSLSEAMTLAGFLVCPDPEPLASLSLPPGDPDLAPLGADAEKSVQLSLYENFVTDLAEFRLSIVDVVYNFYLKNGGTHVPLSGLALSLFAAEWDRFHAVRGLAADLKTLRDRFGVVKLMPFLQAIPELDVVGTHPEVRVRIKQGVACRPVAASPRFRKPVWSPTVTPNSSTHDGFSTGNGPRNISLSSELFGEPISAPSTPASLASAPETQTRIVLEQMLASTQTQILAILSTVPADPLAAAAAIERMNELQVLVNALKAALAVLPPVAKKSISIDSELFKPVTLSLDSMLSPHSAAAAAPGVGPLLSDLSRILFAQVIQQQEPTAPQTAAETSAALERTLHDLVSAASSPPASPANDSISSSVGVVNGNFLIPKSLPTSPIPVQEMRESTDDAATMHQLLRGLMGLERPLVAPAGLAAPVAPSAPLRKETNTEKRIYSKAFMLRLRERVAGLETPPPELEGLVCRQVLRAPPVKPRPQTAAR